VFASRCGQRSQCAGYIVATAFGVYQCNQLGEGHGYDAGTMGTRKLCADRECGVVEDLEMVSAEVRPT
jgi:hypothetical protein